MLELASQMSDANVFISEALAKTSSIFSSMDYVVKSIVQITSKLDALKEKKMECDNALLAKK